MVALVLVGCGGGTPAGSADIVAEAGSAILTPEQAAVWAARAPEAPRAGDASYVGLVWVDYTLLTQALEQNVSLTDSATAAQALAPDLILAKLRAWHDTLLARRPGVPADEADSLYASDLRIFQQILIPIEDQRDARQVGAAQEKAESLLGMLRTGADFVALAKQHSQDSFSARDGYLPAGRRKDFFPEFVRNAWRLQPGQLGGMGSRLGLHLVRRPQLDSVRDRILVYAESLSTQRADSVYADSLRAGGKLQVAERATAMLRGFFADPATRATETRPVATWSGGEMSLAQMAGWLDALPPTAYLELRGASDVALAALANDIATQYLLLADAEAHGIQLTAGQWAGLHDGYRRGLGEAMALIGLSDTATSLPAGQGAARVKALLDRLTADRDSWRPLPSALGSFLRARFGYRLHRAGAERAAQLATKLVSAQRPDSGAGSR